MIRAVIKRLYYLILSLFPSRIVIYVEYFRHFGSLPNLSKPIRFCDKMQCLKLDRNMESYSNYVDKYEVRKFIEKTIGKKYLINLIGIYENVEDIDFYSLPNKFVLKCTHGSHYNIICDDIKKLDIEAAKKKLKGWLEEDFYNITREPQYKLVKPRITCEEYLEDRDGAIKDYKFLCFKGEPKIIEVDIDRFTNMKINYYDIHWKLLNMLCCYKKVLFTNTNEEIPKPENLNEMIYLSKVLSKNFKFARVDFYSVNGKTYFGELTFTPASGFETFIPDNINYEIGKLLD